MAYPTIMLEKLSQVGDVINKGLPTDVMYDRAMKAYCNPRWSEFECGHTCVCIIRCWARFCSDVTANTAAKSPAWARTMVAPEATSMK